MFARLRRGFAKELDGTHEYRKRSPLNALDTLLVNVKVPLAAALAEAKGLAERLKALSDALDSVPVVGAAAVQEPGRDEEDDKEALARFEEAKRQYVQETLAESGAALAEIGAPVLRGLLRAARRRPDRRFLEPVGGEAAADPALPQLSPPPALLLNRGEHLPPIRLVRLLPCGPKIRLPLALLEQQQLLEGRHGWEAGDATARFAELMAGLGFQPLEARPCFRLPPHPLRRRSRPRRRRRSAPRSQAAALLLGRSFLRPAAIPARRARTGRTLRRRCCLLRTQRTH